MFRSALALAKRGFAVFPLESKGKRPLGTTVPHGHKDASRDPGMIAWWWHNHPNANIGVACGKASGQLVVIDLDVNVDKKLDGRVELTRLEDEIGKLPKTVTVHTPSSGKHYYFRVPKDVMIRNSASKLAPGIDVRAEGGYVVVPPSQRKDGARWMWLEGGEDIAKLPQEWIERLIAPQPCKVPPPPSGGTEDSRRSNSAIGVVDTYVSAALEAELNAIRGATEGRRNVQLNESALALGKFVGGGQLPRADVEAALLDAAMDVGLHQSEAAKTILSGIESGQKEPRVPSRSKVEKNMPGSKRHFPTNDLENADRLIEEHGRELRYCYPWRSWLEWTGKCWKREAQAAVDHRASNTARRLLEEAVREADEEVRRSQVKIANNTHSHRRRRDMVASAQHMVSVLPDDFDADPWLLNCENGILNLRDGKLRPHHPSALLTRMAGTTYDPEAKAPRWSAFLNTVLDRNEELGAFVQRAVGYSLTGDVGEQVFFLLIGPEGNNGKSTLLDTISSVLGDHATTMGFKVLLDDKHGRNKDPELADLDGPRFVCASEPNASSQMDEALIKRLTGCDRITVARKYENPFTFRPRCKLWLACNSPPRIPRGGKAMQRRILVIPFNVVIPEKDRIPAFEQVLLEERDGILAWAVRGCMAWQKDRLNPPDSVRLARDGYITDQDPISDWLAQRTVKVLGAQTPLTELHESYRLHAEAAGMHPVANRTLAAMLRERGFFLKRTTGGYQVMDLSLSDGEQDNMDEREWFK